MKNYFKKVESKKIGDLKCNEIICGKCPLYCVRCGVYGVLSNSTLREILSEALKKYPELEPLRTVIEAELDKEVEE